MTNKNSRSVAVWCVSLADNDWYYVFARSDTQALRIVVDAHYERMPTREFKRQYRPTVSRVPDREKIMVNDEERGQQNYTAKRWAKDETPGLFCSNTYEV